MSKIDTQGMSGPVDPTYKGPVRMQPHKPMMIRPRRLFTPEYVREFKILLNEVLHEREGKTGESYLDSEKFEHRINESEPPYQPYQ